MITRQCIEPSIEFQYHDKMVHIKTYVHEDLCARIDRWKMFYIEQYNAQPGQTILIDFVVMTIDYFASVFAAAELGLVLVNGVPTEWRKQNGKEDMPVPQIETQIDYILNFDTKSDWDHALYTALGKNVIPNAYWQDYQVVDNELLNSVKDIVRCTEDSILTLDLRDHSTATHKKIFATSKRLASVLGYTTWGSMVHTKNMHLLDSNFCWSLLPSFMTTRHHYVFNDADVPNGSDYFDMLGAFVVENRINFVSVNHVVAGALKRLLTAVGAVDFDLTINTTAAVGRDIADLMQRNNVKGVNGIFGNSSKTMGLFVRRVDATTDRSRLQLNNFGAPVDDFYEFQLNNHQLYYKCSTLNEDWQTDGDLFILTNNEYHYAGRA